MSINDKFKLEKEGITATVDDYTTEKYIASYSKQLRDLSLPEDFDLIKEIVTRLVDWYETNINDIRNSRFIENKEEHTKSMSLLQEFKRELCNG